MMHDTQLRSRFHRRVRLAVIAGLALAVAMPALSAPAAAQSASRRATAPSPAPVRAQPALPDPELADALRRSGGIPREVERFYAARDWAPLWVANGRVGRAADTLIDLIRTARLDGLDPESYRLRPILDAIDRSADGSPRALARAEMLLTRGYIALARDMARPRDVGVIYADAELRPEAPDTGELLRRAGGAPSLNAWLERVGWMNPAYADLRMAAIAWVGEDDVRDRDPDKVRLIRMNLDRARALPEGHGGRFVLVDAAAARLWMYDKGRVVDTMRVVVGKPTDPTPLMAAMIRYAAVNPYWNLPPDLVPSRVALGVLARGASHLKARNYEILSDWSDDARILPASAVDWRAVADGRTELRVRQRPGPGNPMGRIKFMFPNEQGVYLHDTNEKGLLRGGERLFSAGCVRVEDAPRLARWLFGRPIPLTGTRPEQRVDLPGAVPVYLTYLTASAEGKKLVFRDDVYGRDDPGGGYRTR